MRPLLALAALLAIAAPAALATHDAGCVPDRNTVLLDTGVVPGAPRIYVDFQLHNVGPLWELWIYEESNGLDGLQRADEVELDESCGHGGDTIIF